MPSLRSLSLAALLISMPLTALALEGIGPRVTIVGEVTEITMTKQQRFDKVGGNFVIIAANGQEVTANLDAQTRIIPEGRLSRRTLSPTDVAVGNRLKITGRRQGSNALTASLIVILNLEKQQELTDQGMIQAIGPDSLTVRLPSGTEKMFAIDSTTTFYVSYTLSGGEALTLIGKQAFLTMNPQDPRQLRIVRITGKPALR